MRRDQLEAALDYAREGDTLVVTKLDRLARPPGFEKTLKLLADSHDPAKAPPVLQPQVIALGKKSCLVKPRRVVRRADLLIPLPEGM